MAVPTKDSLLLNWSTNFNTRGTATPLVFNLTASQMTAYTPLHTAFATSYNAANQPGARSKALTRDKNTAKAALLAYARELYGFIQSSTTVSDANKDLIGVTVRAQPAPQPAPATKPILKITSVSGVVVSITLSSSATNSRRGKPKAVAGATVMSYIGATPPTSATGWTLEGNTSKTTLDVRFPSETVPGTKVWLCAFWYSAKALSGEACDPVSTYLQGGGMSMQDTMSLAA